MSGNSMPSYAQLGWTAADVQSVRPHWSLARCERELAENEKYVRDRLTELGWEVLETLLPSHGDSFVIVSPSEEGFWNNETGWGSFADSNIFDDEEQVAFNLPASRGNDARWLSLREAKPIHGVHPFADNAQFESEAVSTRRHENTVQRLCRDVLAAEGITTPASVKMRPFVVRNDAVLQAMLAGVLSADVADTTVAFSFALADTGATIMPCEVTVADLRKARPVGDDGFSLRTASELYCGPRIIARFQPQVWVFDNAMDIEGECGVDVTRKVLAREVSDIRAMQNDTYASDHLVDLAALDHDGPFEVNVEDAICAYFGVAELSEIDERMLQRERNRLRIVVAPSTEAP